MSAVRPSPRAAGVAEAPRIIRREEAATHHQAQDALRVAKERSESLLRRAEATAHEEGLRGFALGVRTARCEQAEIIVQTLVERDAYLASAEQQLVSVVVNAVRKIVGSFDDFSLTRAVVSSALASVRQQASATVRVAAGHVDELNAVVDELKALCPHLTVLKIVGDALLPPGTCVLVSDLGTVSTDIDGQLRAIEAAVARATR